MSKLQMQITQLFGDDDDVSRKRRHSPSTLSSSRRRRHGERNERSKRDRGQRTRSRSRNSRCQRRCDSACVSHFSTGKIREAIGSLAMSRRLKRRRSSEKRTGSKLQMQFRSDDDDVSRIRRHSPSTLSSSRRRRHGERNGRSKRDRGQRTRRRSRTGDAEATMDVVALDVGEDQRSPTIIVIATDDDKDAGDCRTAEESRGAKIKSELIINNSDDDEDTRDCWTAEESRGAEIKSELIVDITSDNDEVPRGARTKSGPPSEDSDTTIDEEELRRENARAHCLTLTNAWKDVTACGLSKEAYARLKEKDRASGDTRGGFAPPILNRELKCRLSGVDIVEDESKMELQSLLGGLMRAAEMSVATVVECNVRSSELAQMADLVNDVATFLASLHYDESMKRRRCVIEALGTAATLMREIREGDSLFSRQEVEEIELEIERNAKAEAEKREREEAERIAREEAERIAREEAERFAREEAERIAREEAERIAREAAQRIANEEAEKRAKEEAERIANEEAVKRAKEDAERAKEAERKAAAEEEARTRRVENENAAATRLVENENREQRAEVGGSNWRIKSVKAEKNSTQYVPTSDFPGIKRMATIARLREGYAEVAIPIVFDRFSQSTLDSYERQLKAWWDFGKRENVDIFNPKMSDVMQFLCECRQNKATYSTLCTARSALSFILGNDLGKDCRLAGLYKGFAKDLERKETVWKPSKKANQSL